MTSTTEKLGNDTQQIQKHAIRQGLLQSLDHCIRANPFNYFITIPVNALPLLLEKLYMFDVKSQVSANRCLLPSIEKFLNLSYYVEGHHFEPLGVCYVGPELRAV